MIELRWKVPAGTSTQPPVLQYRVAQLSIMADGGITPCPLPMTWHDWQDVPFVAVADVPSKRNHSA